MVFLSGAIYNQREQVRVPRLTDDGPSRLPQRLNLQPFAYEMNTEAPCRAKSKAVRLIAKQLNSPFRIIPIIRSCDPAEAPQHVKLARSSHSLATGSFIFVARSLRDPFPHPPSSSPTAFTLFLHCNQPDNSTFMTYSLHKQTQVQTAAQQTLLKHFLLQLPLQSSVRA